MADQARANVASAANLTYFGAPLGPRKGRRWLGKWAAMKFTIDIDCTPEEARTFLGLPDVQPMQTALMDEVQARLMHSLSAMDPETLFKTWLPTQVHSLDQFQKLFWSQMSAQFGGQTRRDEE